MTKKQAAKYTKASALAVIQKRGLHFIKVQKLVNGILYLIDEDYGPYKGAVQNLAPSMKFPLHKERASQDKYEKARATQVGTKVRGLEILDLYRAAQLGYQGRGYLAKVLGECGHVLITSLAHLRNHRKTLKCKDCARIVHGARAKAGGIRLKRTEVYNSWARLKDTLPEKYHDYETFRLEVGPKPTLRARIRVERRKPRWILPVSEDVDLAVITAALRRAFKYSTHYKKCLDDARIQTEEGTRYICAACGKTSRRKDIQIDHVYPIAGLGTPLTKQNVLKRVWTSNVQALDKVCHQKKTTAERAKRKSTHETKKSKK